MDCLTYQCVNDWDLWLDKVNECWIHQVVGSQSQGLGPWFWDHEFHRIPWCYCLAWGASIWSWEQPQWGPCFSCHFQCWTRHVKSQLWWDTQHVVWCHVFARCRTQRPYPSPTTVKSVWNLLPPLGVLEPRLESDIIRLWLKTKNPATGGPLNLNLTCTPRACVAKERAYLVSSKVEPTFLLGSASNWGEKTQYPLFRRSFVIARLRFHDPPSGKFHQYQCSMVKQLNSCFLYFSCEWGAMEYSLCIIFCSFIHMLLNPWNPRNKLLSLTCRAHL